MASPQHDVLSRFVAAYNARDDEALDPLVTPAYVHHSNDATLSLAQFKRGAAWFRAGCPDFRIEVQDVVEAGDRAAVRFIATGTHEASLFGEAPSGATLRLHGMTMYRFEDGRIAEDWEFMDEGDLRRQVGAMPPER